MSGRLAWSLYAVAAAAVAPAVFRLRYGRWPFATGFPPRTGYDAVNWLFFLALVLYTGSLWIGPVPRPLSVPGGLALLAAGCGLQLWAWLAMGANWRMGQDASDRDRVRFVRSGPFRFLRHPIYVGFVVVALGQLLLAGADSRSVLLVLTTVVYLAIQGSAETRHWRRREPPTS